MTDHHDPTTPLAGVRVLDLSRMLPVGALTQLLADLGAEVVKVERPGAGEESRGHGPAVAGTTATHAFLDRGKRSVALDLKDPRGVRAVHALAAACDVVVESFRPGVADRLGVGWDDLRTVNPRLVYCSVNGYGTGGPREQEPGHDLNYLAYAGATGFGGSRAHGPAVGGIQTADLLGGLTGGIGLLAALVAVRAGAPGRRVEVGLADAALWALGLHVSGWLAGGGAEGPEATTVTGASASYRVYACADGRHLAVGAVEPQFWAAFTDVIGRPDLRTRQHDPAAVDEVAAAVATRTLAEWQEALGDRETCAGPVQDFAEVRDDPQFRARGMLVPVPGDPGVEQVGTPVRLDGRTRHPDRPAAPAVGQDTSTVLAACDVDDDVRAAALRWASGRPADALPELQEDPA
ncbi:CaiB/BaiF CoA-transferase family protein [Nocardioides zeae]|uniref:CaiB/BaiF CoA-transferase family protein n=1 Tax=Nocardioides imazamoxiresistens TaxID=3231893 RepID=A0ABU3PR15_9ACTN|nr:CaiB/BaiF CoA-transferase family protein [Nocardioides zeae]MDT9591662.1 CaiB/BaiF CoA-transferase family protein [Nocardioides zeae]